MSLPPYPVPPDLCVADIGQRDLRIQCPRCKVQRFNLGYNLTLKLPPDTLLAHYAARHVCQACSRPGRAVRCVGWISDPPRSGAEGYNQRVSASASPSPARPAPAPRTDP